MNTEQIDEDRDDISRYDDGDYEEIEPLLSEDEQDYRSDVGWPFN